MEQEKVKQDLRELKKTVHLIDTLIRTRDEYAYRIKRLSESNRIKSKKEALALESLISKIDIERHVKKALEIQSRYTGAIAQLGTVDKTILIEYYINGTPAFKVGRTLGYSEDGIRKRLGKAIKKIAQMM